MGIFDSLKNMTNQAVKNNVSKAVSGAVNNAMHKSKTFVFADYPKKYSKIGRAVMLQLPRTTSTCQRMEFIMFHRAQTRCGLTASWSSTTLTR